MNYLNEQNHTSSTAPSVEKREVYADHAAATPIDSEVLEIMASIARDFPSNPSSLHTGGRNARAVLENAREQVAKTLSAHADEIIFTGGGTESDNLAILGTARAYGARGKHIILSSIEHKAVLECIPVLLREGFEVTMLPVDHSGVIDLSVLKEIVRDDTILISVMYVNNEIGTVEPIQNINALLHERRAKTGLPILHTDACQAVGFLPISPTKLGVDLLTLNGSKIYGPRGVGILYRRNGVTVEPNVVGGGQEHNLRAGTENLPAIVGFSHALEKSETLRDSESSRLHALRKTCIEGLIARIPEIIINGNQENPAPHIVHVTVPGVEGESMLLMLDAAGIEVATGSACSSHELKPSHVLTAIGQSDELIHGSIRFSFGRDTIEDDIWYILEVFPPIIARLRMISSVSNIHHANTRK